MEYAIVDIETTGGYASGAGITEIAVFIHDGQKVIDQYEMLINPHQYIPLPIQLLTGINNEMVEGKPTFEDIAEDLYRMLDGRVFVAHSVNFDYSFIRHHFEKAGFRFNASKLCTVRMSRKIRPGLPSYSLGKLCASLNIPLYNNHRAGGDAAATALLFGKLIEWDDAGVIAGMLKKNSKEQLLPPHLPKEDFEALPAAAGVYYFRNREGKVVYVGKANDLRKRVLSHFTGNNTLRQRQHFLKDIHSISFERCGTELMSFLLEAVEITRLWPVYNRAMKRRIVNFGLYAYEDLNGFMRLVIGKQTSQQLALHEFTTEIEGRNLLHKLVRNFDLCPELCGIAACSHDTPAAETETSLCFAAQGVAAYNEQVKRALVQLETYLPSFLIKDKGRHETEQSCILIERGRFYGMGYIDTYGDIQSLEDIKSSLTSYKVNHYMLQLIYNYAEKYPGKVIKLRTEDMAGASF